MNVVKNKEGKKVELHYILIATRPHENLRLLERAAQFFGWKYKVLGMGEEWKGFGTKLELVSKYLASVPTEAIVLHTDAFDVIPTQTPQQVYDQYLMLHADVVFAGETNTWPDKIDRKYKKITENKGTYHFLNSGCYIGKAPVLKKLLVENKYAPQDDDQRFWTSLYLKQFSQRGFIVLDTEATIFQCFYGCDDYSTRGHAHVPDAIFPFANLVTHSKPSFLHFNGSVYNFATYFQTLVKGTNNFNQSL